MPGRAWHAEARNGAWMRSTGIWNWHAYCWFAGRWPSPASTGEAGQMIEQFGYGRRRRELDALERRSSLDCARLGRDKSKR